MNHNHSDIRILSVYSGFLAKSSGTPLRVKGLLRKLCDDTDLVLQTASQDKEAPFPEESHCVLSKSRIRNILILNKYIKQNRINVVIYHTITSARLLIPLFILNPRVKRVLETHGFLEEELRMCGQISPIRYRANKVLHAYIYIICNAITTCSDTATMRLKKFNSNTRTVYGGVDLDKFFPEKNSLRETANSKLTLGYSGNGRRWQGLGFLLKAFEKIHEKDENTRLHLLLSEKVNLNDQDGVFVFGPVEHEQVRNFNVNCDILVIPREENEVSRLSFPSKLMEYLAMGIPVVASTTSDAHKIITHGLNGLLYKPGDTGSFIKCIESLRSFEIRRKIGKNGNCTASRYSWEIQGELFKLIVKNLK